MSSVLLPRVHMIAFATSSLLQHNRSSRIWDAFSPQFNFSVPSISAMSLFSGDVYNYKKRRRTAKFQMARDSNVKGNTKEAEHNAESENSDKQEKSGGKESEDDFNILKYDNHSMSDNLENEESRSSPGNSEESSLISGETAIKGTVIAGLLLVGLVGGIGAVSYIYRDQINDFLVEFSDILEGYGVAGYALFVAVYAGLEILAIPAIPLTMSAGLLFGTVTGTIIVSVSGTIAATAAFLIARYLARDRILKLAEGNKKFLAIDKAIGENGFRIVALLRLSPLLPFSLGNYLYGLTSVKLVPYVLGSWLGMLPGTWAYVSAGAVGRAIIQQEAENGLSGGPEQLLTLGAGLLVTVIAATYVTRLAKDAIKDIE